MGLFGFFFQSCLCCLDCFAVFCEVSIHKLIFDFRVAANSALLNFLITVNDTFFDFFVTARYGFSDL